MPRYIDADALMERLKLQYGEKLGLQCHVNMSDVADMIEDTPTADVAEVRHAKWVHPTMYSENVCSQCGRSQNIFFGFLSPYCPNCGAKMDAERSEQ